MSIQLKEVEFGEIFEVQDQIPEFDEGDFEQRYRDRIPENDSLILLAELDGGKAGYSVAYDKFGDNSFYLWMAGVVPEARRKGVMTRMLERVEEVASDRGYEEVKIKTRNERKGMRCLLIDQGYDVCGYNEFDDIERSEILEKKKV